MIRRGSRRPDTSGRRATRLVRTLTATASTLAAVGLSVGGTLASAAPSSRVPTTYAGTSARALEHRPAVTPVKDVAVIVLDTLSPAVVSPGKDVTITGTVTAPLTGPLSSPKLQVVRGDVTVNQRAALDDWASGRTPTSGRTVATTAVPTVPAGQTRPFTTTVPWGRLRSADAFAAVPISVDVVQQGATEPTGRTRTFIAWNGRKEYVPLKVATVLPLTLDPDVGLFSRNDATRESAWQRAIGPDSRVARILDGTSGAHVDLAVDPSVLGPDLAAGSSSGAGSAPGGATPTPSGTASGTPATPSTPDTGTTPTTPTAPTAPRPLPRPRAPRRPRPPPPSRASATSS